MINMDDKYNAINKSILERTGHWGKYGAGCLLYSKSSKKFMVGLRSEDVLEPNTWSTFGGAVDGDSSLIDTVRNELYEEIGILDDMIIDMIPIFVYNGKHDFKYHNFIAIVDEEFTPNLNWENSDYMWLSVDGILKLENKHYGLQALLNDTETIKIMRELES